MIKVQQEGRQDFGFKQGKDTKLHSKELHHYLLSVMQSHGTQTIESKER